MPQPEEKDPAKIFAEWLRGDDQVDDITEVGRQNAPQRVAATDKSQGQGGDGVDSGPAYFARLMQASLGRGWS